MTSREKTAVLNILGFFPSVLAGKTFTKTYVLNISFGKILL